MQGQDLQAFLFDLHIPAVDFVVAVDQIGRLFGNRLAQFFHRAIHQFFDHGAHGKDRLVQGVHVAAEMNGHWNRQVNCC